MNKDDLKKLMPECSGTEAEYCICRAATSLTPLFSAAKEDRADSLLGSYPNTSSIVEGLKMLVDVMFPGRMSQDSIESDELGIFLVRRLSDAWGLLRPEVERQIAVSAHPTSFLSFFLNWFKDRWPGAIPKNSPSGGIAPKRTWEGGPAFRGGNPLGFPVSVGPFRSLF